MPEFDVFLSYSRVDETWVTKLKDNLQRYGVSVWLDKDEIRPGDLFVEALQKGLENCQAVALIVSPAALLSGWVKEESSRALSLAQNKNFCLRLIPVILGDAELSGFLESREWVDFREESAYSENVWELVWGITGNKPAEVLDLDAPNLPSGTSITSARQTETLTENIATSNDLPQKLQIADADQDKSKPAAATTTQNDTLKGEDQEKTVPQLSEDKRRQPIAPSPALITGSKVFIDTSWWESASENDQGMRPMPPNLRVYPTLPGRPQELRMIMSRREFTVDIQANHIFLDEERRDGVQKHEPVEFSESNTAEIIGDVKWIFTRYASSELVRFDDRALREIAISFDPETVKEAVMVKRERIGRQRRIRDDYYLLVFKNE